MNPGAVEEAGQTARSALEVFKGQAALLSLMLVNVALLVFIFYALHAAAKTREQLISKVFENSNAIHQMIQQRAVVCPP